MMSLIYGNVKTLNTLVPSRYDDIVLTWGGGNLTQVVYTYLGVTVATLTLTYDGSDNLIQVTKS